MLEAEATERVVQLDLRHATPRVVSPVGNSAGWVGGFIDQRDATLDVPGIATGTLGMGHCQLSYRTQIGTRVNSN